MDLTLAEIEAKHGKKVADLDYRPAVQVLLVSPQNEILVVNKPIYKANEWDFPGGGTDGDPTDIAAVREVEEELGFNIDITKLKRSKYNHQFDWPEQGIVNHYNGRNEFFRGQRKDIYVYFMDSKPEIKRQEEEITKVEWVPAERLEDYMNFPGQAELFAKVLQEFNLV